MTTHGMTGTPTWISWRCMLSSCLNPRNHAYVRYGGAGIEVCPEWRTSFKAFYRDLGARPDGCTLDRIDSTKGYTRENTRWASLEVQNNHLRTCHYIDHDCERLSVADWARRLIIPYPRAYAWLVEQHLPIEVVKQRLDLIGQSQDCQSRAAGRPAL